MNQSQLKDMQMYEATNEYLNNNYDIWSPIPVIGNYKNHLSLIISCILKLTSEESNSPPLVNGALRTVKLQLADKMDQLDDIMETYASDIGDEKLRLQSANTHMDYINLANEQFEMKVRKVIALLERYVGEMADYGINSEQIDDAKLCFNDYLRKKGMPQSYQIDSGIVAQDLPGLFKEACIYIKKMDIVMQRFRRSNIQFFIGYQSVRLARDN